MTGLPVGPELLADYEALRHGAGAGWLPRDVVRLAGPQAIDYLQGQLSQDVAGLAVGRSALSFLLQPQGKVDALLRATRVEDDVMVLDVDGGWGEAVAARLARFRLRMKVEIEPLSGWRVLGLRGPGVEAALAAAPSSVAPPASAPEGSVVADPQWPGLSGVDLLGPGLQVPPGVRECGPEAWAAVRVEAGVPAMGRELSEKTIPAEAGLLEAAVSFTKGCYTGQELVARLDARGNRVPRRLRGVVLAGDDLGERPLPPQGAEIADGERVVGALTTVAVSPGLNAVVALAYVRREVEPPATLALRWEAGAVPIEVRALPLVE